MNSALTYRFKQYQQADDLNEFVIQFAPLVKRVAEKIYRRCPDALELDDLIQAGIIGLIQAKHSFQKKFGAGFKTYASMKIQYAVYEEIRKHTGITREFSQYIKKITAAISEIEQNQQEMSHRRIAEAAGVSDRQYQSMNEVIKAHKTLSLDELSASSSIEAEASASPFDLTLKAELSSKLKELLQQLPKREQLILTLYYHEFLSFKEIAVILDLTEARISQIHQGLMKKLQARMAAVYS